jgi:Protein of unknown function (DUF4231)
VTPDTTSVAYKRLEDQIDWYDGKAEFNQRWYWSLKVVQIVAAAVVPVTAGESAPTWVTGGLGALIVVVEGMQQLFQLQPSWSRYRSTCEALRHEQYLYLSQAGHYRNADRLDALLAERVEGLVSQEHASWSSAQEAAAKAGEG